MTSRREQRSRRVIGPVPSHRADGELLHGVRRRRGFFPWRMFGRGCAVFLEVRGGEGPQSSSKPQIQSSSREVLSRTVKAVLLLQAGQFLRNVTVIPGVKSSYDHLEMTSYQPFQNLA